MDEDELKSKTIEEMYEIATWRMYYRIVNARKNRATLAAISPEDKLTISKSKQALSHVNTYSRNRRDNSDILASSLGLSRKNDETSYSIKRKENIEHPLRTSILTENEFVSTRDPETCEKEMMFMIDM